MVRLTDEDDAEGKEHSGEEVEVLGVFVADGGLLEDAEVASSGCEEVEPLPARYICEQEFEYD
jgi:hypothetical protein